VRFVLHKAVFAWALTWWEKGGGECSPPPKYFFCLRIVFPIPVTARSKVWVCSRSLAGIVGSNPAGGMDVCFL